MAESVDLLRQKIELAARFYTRSHTRRLSDGRVIEVASHFAKPEHLSPKQLADSFRFLKDSQKKPDPEHHEEFQRQLAAVVNEARSRMDQGVLTSAERNSLRKIVYWPVQNATPAPTLANVWAVVTAAFKGAGLSVQETKDGSPVVTIPAGTVSFTWSPAVSGLTPTIHFQGGKDEPRNPVALGEAIALLEALQELPVDNVTEETVDAASEDVSATIEETLGEPDEDSSELLEGAEVAQEYLWFTVFQTLGVADDADFYRPLESKALAVRETPLYVSVRRTANGSVTTVYDVNLDEIVARVDSVHSELTTADEIVEAIKPQVAAFGLNWEDFDAAQPKSFAQMEVAHWKFFLEGASTEELNRVQQDNLSSDDPDTTLDEAIDEIKEDTGAPLVLDEKAVSESDLLYSELVNSAVDKD